MGLRDSGHIEGLHEGLEQSCAVLGRHGRLQEIPHQTVEVSSLFKTFMFHNQLAHTNSYLLHVHLTVDLEEPTGYSHAMKVK